MQSHRIDLGTTNSAIAHGRWRADDHSELGGRTHHPVVRRVHKNRERLVRPGREDGMSITEPREHDLSRSSDSWGVGFHHPRSSDHEEGLVQDEPAPNGGVLIVLGVGKKLTPPEVSAMILQKLKADPEAYLGEKVTQRSSRSGVFRRLSSGRRRRTRVRSPA